MIKRAQRQFVLSAMGAMGFCVVALIAVINIVHFAQTERRLGSALDEMVAAVEAVIDVQEQENEAEPEWRVESFVEEVTPEPTQTPPVVSQQPETDSLPAADTPHFFGENGGKHGKWNRYWGNETPVVQQETAESAGSDAVAAEEPPPVEPEERIINHYYYYYETENDAQPDLRNTALNQYAGRFFIVNIPETGAAVADMSEESAISETDAVALAETMLEEGSDSGYLDDYRYLVKKTGGANRVYVLDCATERSAMRSLLLLSCLVGVGGLLLAFGFVMRMSKKAIWPLQESMERQKRFITDAGHELKTPLAVIGTNMDILTMDIGDNEWVTGTQSQLRRLRKLVANLISLSRLEEDQEAMELQYFSISDTAMECVDSFSGMAELEGKELEAGIEPGLTVRGDMMTVGQLCAILCDNAVKYAEGDGRIQVRLYASGKRVYFETENDWSHTLAPEDLEHLFDRFYRGDAARSKDGNRSGYGLGLSIAKAIAEKNHAQIAVRETGQGRLLFQVVFKLEKQREG